MVGVFHLADGHVVGHVDRLGRSPAQEGLHGRHHLDVTGVVDESPPVAAVAIGRVEHGQVLVCQVGSPLDGLPSADRIVGVCHLLAAEAELGEEVEVRRVVFAGAETERLQRVLAHHPGTEGVAQLEQRREGTFDLDQIVVGEALLDQAVPVDVGGAQQIVGADHVVDDVVDLILAIAERPQRGGHRLVDDLEVAASGQLLELHQGEVGLYPGGVAIEQQSDRAGRRQHARLPVAVAVLLAPLQSQVPSSASFLEEIVGAMIRVDTHHPMAHPLVLVG